MKRLNKKAQAGYTPETSIFYLVFGIVISFMMVIFMVLIFNHLEDTAKIPGGIEEFSAIERFQSEECFSLEGSRVIDWNRFTKENLDLCYNVGEGSKKMAFDLKLQVQGELKEIKTNNWYEGIDVGKIRSPIDVRVYYNNEIVDGRLIIGERNV